MAVRDGRPPLTVSPDDVPPHAILVLRRMLLRRGLPVDAEDARLIVANIVAALAGASTPRTDGA
jgi:hypothetical protein